MTRIPTDLETYDEWRARRRDSLGDRYDEVWDGVEILVALPDNEHQEIRGTLATCFVITIDHNRLGKSRAGIGLSDRVEDWLENYRVPDVVVFLHGSPSTNHGTHWSGSPDFVVEIISKDDSSRDKLGFYEKIKTREVLLVDRYPWALELMRFQDGRLILIDRSTLAEPATLVSEAIPFSFRLIEGENRPMIEVTHRVGVQRWIV